MSQGPATADPGVLLLIHHHPGRLRLRSEAFQDNDTVAARAREALSASKEVLGVEHDALTGSLLIEYQPGEVEPDALLERAAQAAGLCPGRGGPCKPDRPQGERFIRACRDLNAAAYEMTGFRVEPRTLAPVAVAALSATFFVLNKGQRMPRWDNLAYWALSLFTMLHGREIGAAGAGAK